MAIYFQPESKHNLWGFREQRAEDKHFRKLRRKFSFLSGTKDPLIDVDNSHFSNTRCGTKRHELSSVP